MTRDRVAIAQIQRSAGQSSHSNTGVDPPAVRPRRPGLLRWGEAHKQK